MPLSQEIIDRVREASDIVAVVGEHVQLKRTGRAWKACCPFHKEKTPSFTVNADRQIFKCFGCGVGGDVYRFLMDFEKLSFPEAVEVLAARAGIPLPRRGWEGPREESVYPALEWAAGHYRKLLISPGGKPGRDYLTGRGIQEETAKRFGLGWAPDAWSTLLDAAGKRYPPELLRRAGLVTSRDRGGFYDRFRKRLTIPIRSALGKAIGFGARIVGDGEPKYLNSPETEVFSKGRVLYGLAEAREALKTTGEGLVVEGYLDVLSLAQAGFGNAVAACGTAFTADQARVLKRYVERVVLVFDGDAAGVRAAWKSAGVFLGEGLEVRIVTLPGQHDPDSFVREKGPEAFRNLATEAPGVVRFARETLLDRLEKREDLIRAFAYLAGRIEDPIRRRVLVQEAAETFRFDERVLAQATVRYLKGERRSTDRPAVAAARTESRDVLGRRYLAALLGGAAVAPEDDPVPADALREEKLRALYGAWLSFMDEDPARVRARLLEAEETRAFAAELLAADDGGEVRFEELHRRLVERARGDRGRILLEAIQRAETEGKQAEVDRLSRELQSLKEVG